jgi:hypothetical protein
LKCTPAETEGRHIEQAALTVFLTDGSRVGKDMAMFVGGILRKAKPSDAGIVAADGGGSSSARSLLELRRFQDDEDVERLAREVVFDSATRPRYA